MLAKLNAKGVSPEEKERLVKSLGRLGTPAAIDYLIAHHDFTVFPHENTAPDAVGKVDLARTPCIEALAEIGVCAVPKMVEAYLTLPGDRWPEGFLTAFESSTSVARAAYVYAQGYLFTNKEDGHRRDAVVTLIKELGRKLQFGDLPYPPPWFGEQPEFKKP